MNESENKKQPGENESGAGPSPDPRPPDSGENESGENQQTYPIRFYIEDPTGEVYRAETSSDTLVRDVATDFFEERGRPDRDDAGELQRVAIERIDPNNPERGQRLHSDQTLHDVGVRDDDTLRVLLETTAVGNNPLVDLADAIRMREDGKRTIIRRMVYIVLPRQVFEDEYAYVQLRETINAAVRDANCEPRFNHPSNFRDGRFIALAANIKQSQVVIADITGFDSYVMSALSIAFVLHENVIVLFRDGDVLLPSILQEEHCIWYDQSNLDVLREEITESLEKSEYLQPAEGERMLQAIEQLLQQNEQHHQILLAELRMHNEQLRHDNKQLREEMHEALNAYHTTLSEIDKLFCNMQERFLAKIMSDVAHARTMPLIRRSSIEREIERLHSECDIARERLSLVRKEIYRSGYKEILVLEEAKLTFELQIRSEEIARLVVQANIRDSWPDRGTAE
jgi:hypothetical protein